MTFQWNTKRLSGLSENVDARNTCVLAAFAKEMFLQTLTKNSEPSNRHTRETLPVVRQRSVLEMGATVSSDSWIETRYAEDPHIIFKWIEDKQHKRALKLIKLKPECLHLRIQDGSYKSGRTPLIHAYANVRGDASLVCAQSYQWILPPLNQPTYWVSLH